MVGVEWLLVFRSSSRRDLVTSTFDAKEMTDKLKELTGTRSSYQFMAVVHSKWIPVPGGFIDLNPDQEEAGND